AYLHPVRRRANLDVQTRSRARRIVFERGRAVGVEYARGGSVQVVRAEREVILAAGAVASPQLLLLSGLGPARDLEALGIPVIADRPEVGRNLQDHLDFCTVVKSRRPITYDFNRVEQLAV